VPLILNYILQGCFALYLILIIIGGVRRQSGIWKEVAGLVVAFAILHWTVGFPRAVVQTFSPTSTVATIVLMFVCVLIGMICNYFFELRVRFTWLSFLKPLLVSPIVLLPLIGVVETRPEVGSLELISFAFLAFQNGFFWRSVFKRAHTQTE